MLLGLATPGGQALVARLQDLPMVQQAGIASLGQLVGEVGKIRLGSPWTYLLLAGMIGWVLALLAGVARWARRAPTSETRPRAGRMNASGTTPPIYQSTNLPVITFALLTLLTALLLTFSVEFVYLRDTFGTRMNTVFKFYFQAWVLLALVASFSVVYLARFAGAGAALGRA